MARKFQLKSNFSPKGDQPKAIQTLLDGIEAGEKYQTLVGVTGSGKTFTLANVISFVLLGICIFFSSFNFKNSLITIS
ncbi:MAG: hypothetical protein HOF37_09730 [Rhodobacterales bacterium]|nr:hypothetical protein [Rhodobacterales bacterium]